MEMENNPASGSALHKLHAWENLLLDTGKRNNLVNFKDAKSSTAEIVAPDFATLFSRAEHAAEFEVFAAEEKTDDGATEAQGGYLTKQEYVATYAETLKKRQVLVYSASGQPLQALKNISKKAQTAIEETGINIAYLAFGFIHWAERENPTHVMRAPVLLVPVTIRNDSPLSPYYIKVIDDVIVNPTFAFKLQHEYGVKMPEFDEEEGLDVYWNKLSAALSVPRWWADKDCKIGLFSFQKINMYEDLKENALRVAENANVRALLGEKDVVLGGERVHGCDLLELRNVVDADSSQAEAVALAKAGVSFVLQGPPGTGKSQTITNIIAECIGDGKSVLFVSEKLAALNVVYDKLKKAGLDEFCLELHSHKANKRQVIDELCNTLRLPKSRVADSAERVLRGKRYAVEKLDGYADELHAVRAPIQKSFYQLFQAFCQYQNAPDVDFLISDLDTKGEDYLEEAEAQLLRYAETSPAIGVDYHQNVWYGYTAADSSYKAVSQLKGDLAATASYARKLRELCQKAATVYATNADCIEHAHALGKLFALGKDSRFITPALLHTERVEEGILLVQRLGGLAADILARKAALDEKLDADVYQLDGKNIHKKLTRQFGGFFSRLFSGEYRELITKIRLCKKDGKKPKYDEAVQIADGLGIYQTRVEEFLALQAHTDGWFGKAYDGVNTNFKQLEAELEILRGICLSGVSFGRMARMSAEEFSLNAATFMDMAGAFVNAAYFGGEAESRLASGFDANEYDVHKASLSDLEQKCEGCLENIHALDNWRAFVSVLKNLQALDLRKFVDCAIENGISAENITAAYLKAFYRQWSDKILCETPILLDLTRIPHDGAVENFKEKDELHFEINKSKIREVLSEKRPDLSMVAQGSAISVLLREAEKKRKKKSIRTLLSEIGELAHTLKPCFLMSPLSVSTYLSANAAFDVVIFDEASQIFPQDAVGAIYRGKQLIVVGDSKQMPPSNFFTSTLETDDNEEDDDIVDFESILDLCAASFPQRRLKWHYRSRYEQLIAFSNKNFYANELVTFPSAKADGENVGVDFVYAGGTFDRKSKTNRVEAELIVDMVFEHFQTRPHRSLGVVAFSISQQNLIERLLYKRRRELPNFEEFFSKENPEPFFVKNLETVQGDERDVIIFSVAYAKDAQGRLLMNFGPINREGGERRLNVAFTRAKHNVKIVASMRAFEMDISGTKSEGVRLLRAYLDYAENGQNTVDGGEDSVNAQAQKCSFVQEIAAFLQQNGYTVDVRVGCSEYKIDLAVKGQDSLDYLLAIECDGENYHSSKTARDRDRLRQSVLENMGWKFYRVWSADWFRNPAEEQKRLLAAVENAVRNAPKGESASSASPKAKACFDESVEEQPFVFPLYECADDREIIRRCKKDVARAVGEIVKIEGPISEEWVLKRLVEMFDRKQVTSVVWREYEQKASSFGRWNVVRKKGYLYKKGKEIPMLRVPASGEIPRDIKYIELQELANGLRAILAQNVTAEKRGLFRLLAQQLGFTRLSDSAEARMESALALLGADVELDGNFLSLK